MNMNYSEELNQDLTAYRRLQSKEEKQRFLTVMQNKIAGMTPQQRQEHLKAIESEVRAIAQRVDTARTETV